jgi:hypothetical protein
LPLPFGITTSVSKVETPSLTLAQNQGIGRQPPGLRGPPYVRSAAATYLRTSA